MGRSQTQEKIIYTLGIDVGTGGTRALIMDEQGHVAASAIEDHAAYRKVYPATRGIFR
jgi:N-acetylglucosamine kinase-like BadF-type ATPase